MGEAAAAVEVKEVVPVGKVGKKAYVVTVWQKVNYVVRMTDADAGSADRVFEIVKNPVERIARVGMGDVNKAIQGVVECDLSVLEIAKAENKAS